MTSTTSSREALLRVSYTFSDFLHALKKKNKKQKQTKKQTKTTTTKKNQSKPVLISVVAIITFFLSLISPSFFPCTPHQGSYGRLWLDIEGTQYWGSESSNRDFFDGLVSALKSHNVVSKNLPYITSKFKLKQFITSKTADWSVHQRISMESHHGCG